MRRFLAWMDEEGLAIPVVVFLSFCLLGGLLTVISEPAKTEISEHRNEHGQVIAAIRSYDPADVSKWIVAHPGLRVRNIYRQSSVTFVVCE